MDSINLATISQVLGIASVIFGVLSFLFSRIVIKPLKDSIERLSATLDEIKKTTDGEIQNLYQGMYELSVKEARLEEMVIAADKRISEVCKEK